MVTTTKLRPMNQLPSALREAQALPNDRGILSVYLDTSAVRARQSGHIIAFRDLCQRQRAVMESVDPDSRSNFEQAAAQIDDFLAQLSPVDAPGIGLFTTPASEEVLAIPLPHLTIDRLSWEEGPALMPIEEAIDDFERITLLFFDKELSKFFTIFLGEIVDRSQFRDDVPGKQATGDWFGLSQKRYLRHHEDHVMRHAKRTIRTLSDQLRARPFDRLFVAGPDEAISTLMHLLPRPLQLRFAGRLPLESFATDAEVLAAALEAAETVEREEEYAAVQDLIDSATEKQVELGVDATFAALSEGRVHMLFISSDFHDGGSWCELCAKLSAPVSTCAMCGSTTEPVNDAGERARAMAAEQGARLEIVSGAASDLLKEYGGIGARTRC